jgi:hypothetical protein
MTFGVGVFDIASVAGPLTTYRAYTGGYESDDSVTCLPVAPSHYGANKVEGWSQPYKFFDENSMQHTVKGPALFGESDGEEPQFLYKYNNTTGVLHMIRKRKACNWKEEIVKTSTFTVVSDSSDTTSDNRNAIVPPLYNWLVGELTKAGAGQANEVLPVPTATDGTEGRSDGDDTYTPPPIFDTCNCDSDCPDGKICTAANSCIEGTRSEGAQAGPTANCGTTDVITQGDVITLADIITDTPIDTDTDTETDTDTDTDTDNDTDTETEEGTNWLLVGGGGAVVVALIAAMMLAPKSPTI